MRTQRLLHAIFCGSAALLVACASTHGIKPDAQLRQADSLQAQHSLTGVPLTKAAWPSRDWWTSFHDPQLNKLIAEALKNNPVLSLAEARAQKASARAGIVSSENKPSLDASVGLSGAKLPTSLLPPPTGGDFNWIKNGYLNFSWDLDIWGGSRDAWEAAVDQAHAAKVGQQAARLGLAVDVTRTYAHLGYAMKQKQLAQKELNRAGHAHDLTAQRVKAGIDGKLQLKRAEAEVDTAKGKLAVARHRVDSARIALSVLLGQGPDRGLSIGTPALMTPAKVSIPPDLPANLLGRRPDLVAARWRVEAAGKSVSSAKAKFLPNISLGALAGLVAKNEDALFKTHSSFYQIAPAITLPIFNGGTLRANLGVKSADYNLAVAKYNKTLIGAIDQVTNDLHGLQSLKAQIKAQQHALKAAKQAWQLAEQRYKAGVGSFLEALSVRQQLLKAEQSAAALNARQVDLSIQLIQALGGGFQAEADGSGQVGSNASHSSRSNKGDKTS